MKILATVVTLATLISCSDNNFNQDFLTFELKLVQSQPDPNLTEMSLYNSNLKFYVYDTTYLNNSDIATTEILDWQTIPKIRVNLNEYGRKRFAEFTEHHVNHIAGIIVNNQLVSAPRINAPIKEGQLIIIGFLGHEEAQHISEGILLNE